MTTNEHGQPHAGSPVNWLTVMDHAITQGDERRLWQALYEHHDQEEAHRRMADQMPRLAYSLENGRLRTVELFFAPVVCEQDHPLFKEEGAWPQYSRCVQDALHSWFQTDARMSTFSGLRPYDWVGTWRPAVLREHLLSVMPGYAKKRLEFLTNWLHLPPEAPRLGFVMVAITTEGRWLHLPASSPQVDGRYKMVISGLFHQAEKQEPPAVLPPDHVQYAVASGLRLWLSELHKRVPVTGWTVAPHEQSLDVVKVTLELTSDSVPYMQFPIRRHQIGVEGMHQVLQFLSELAPMLDKPMDVEQRMPQRVVLDLT